MSETPTNQRLGRGLAALIGDYPKQNQPNISDPLGKEGGGASTDGSIAPLSQKEAAKISPQSVSYGDETDMEAIRALGSEQKMAIDNIRVNPRNPRKNFHQEDLENLATSLKNQGMIQPILVRPAENGAKEDYEIVAGERRWRAAKIAQMYEVPIIVKDIHDKLALEIAIVENIQRADLNPLEEGEGYHQLIDEFSYTQAELAEVIGKSRAHVTNMLRLLRLPDDVKAYINNGQLSMGHARALINAQNPSELARMIVENDLSVRETEKLRQQQTEKEVTKGLQAINPPKQKSTDILDLERQLGDILGARVELKDKSGKGELKIKYTSLTDLDNICKRLIGNR